MASDSTKGRGEWLRLADCDLKGVPSLLLPLDQARESVDGQDTDTLRCRLRRYPVGVVWPEEGVHLRTYRCVHVGEELLLRCGTRPIPRLALSRDEKDE